MGRIYLVRHGRPEFHNNETRCIGLTDVPLSDEGRAQMRALAAELPKVSHIYASPLSRARESAELLSLGKAPVRVIEDLHEISMGAWEGLTFDEIRARYPDEYARRGEDMAGFAPPFGESFCECQRRAVRALKTIIDESAGEDSAIVAHAGFNRTLISAIEDMPLAELFSIKQDYASVYTIDGARLFHAKDGGNGVPSRERAENMLRFFVRDERLIAHSCAVAEKACLMAEKAGGARAFDMALVYAAALLHDIKKGVRDHGKAGAQALRALGYARAAKAIENHDRMAVDGTTEVDEALIVFLADKLVSGSEPCSLEERYSSRMSEYAGDERALSAIQKRFSEAQTAFTLYESAVAARNHNI